MIPRLRWLWRCLPRGRLPRLAHARTIVPLWLGLVLAVDFALNFAWEMVQMPLYTPPMTSGRCLVAAGGDVVLTVAALVLAVLLTGGPRWTSLAVGVLLLAAVAVSIEVLALSAGRWSYAVEMPTLARVGLTPVAQLPLIAVMSLWITERACRKRRHRSREGLGVARGAGWRRRHARRPKRT